MKLYDTIIRDTIDVLSSYTPRKLTVSDKLAWEKGHSNEILLRKDSLFELGGSFKSAINYQCVTSTNLIEEDEIILYGEDLNKIDEDIPFARIAFLSIDDLGDDESAYKSIKESEFIKYNMNLKGYMMRASAIDNREQVRVSKSAVDKGISFENIGNSFINEYKKAEFIKRARIIFITLDIPIYKKLAENAKKTNKITLTLNHVLSNMNFDCNSCNLKPICDEVEGMRELHFKNNMR